MTARFISLRPSTLSAQRAKDLSKATTAEKRAARRLRKALDEASAAKAGRRPFKPEPASEAAARGLTQAGFSRWFSEHYAAAHELLPEHELVEFHRLAREFYFGRLARRAWDEVRLGFAAKTTADHGSAADPQTVQELGTGAAFRVVSKTARPAASYRRACAERS